MHSRVELYGTATVGAKGQIVIPAEAREAIGINSGDKLFIVGLKDKKMIGVCPASSLEALVGEMTERLNTLKASIEGEKTT